MFAYLTNRKLFYNLIYIGNACIVKMKLLP